MELDETILRQTPEGETLCKLPSGIEVVRRKKHEPMALDRMKDEELADKTNKINGSKFLPGTSLARIVEMTAEVLENQGASVGVTRVYNTVYEQPIGYSCGRLVKGLQVRTATRGRYAHGYPVDETTI